MNKKFLIVTISLIFLTFSCTPVQHTFKTPDKWLSTNKSEKDFRSYFDDNINKLDFIEGIWTMSETNHWMNVISGIKGKEENASQYRIAIIKDENLDDTFNAFILETRVSGWLKGSLKAKYRTTAYATAYEQIWYMADYSEKITNVIVENKGIVRETVSWADYPINYERETVLLKVYPTITSSSSTNVSRNAKATSSGFLFSESGLVVTNYHSVENFSSIEVIFPLLNKKYNSEIKIKDIKNDIAVLELIDFNYNSTFIEPIPYLLFDANKVKVGEEVFTLGFPLGEILGNKTRLSNGRINSLYGLQDDPRLFQISNPLQPGNSGGPLFNSKGELIGIVVSSLNAKYFYENIGIIPQNVNFAIKSTYLQNLLSMLPEGDQILNRKNLVDQSSMENQIEQINPFIVQIKVY